MEFKIKNVVINDTFICHSLCGGVLDKLCGGDNQFLFLSYSVAGDDVYPVYDRAEAGGVDDAG